MLSGVDPLTDNDTARITMDAVLADIATLGEAELLVECVRVSNGIAEVRADRNLSADQYRRH